MRAGAVPEKKVLLAAIRTTIAFHVELAAGRENTEPHVLEALGAASIVLASVNVAAVLHCIAQHGSIFAPMLAGGSGKAVLDSLPKAAS